MTIWKHVSFTMLVWAVCAISIARQPEAMHIIKAGDTQFQIDPGTFAITAIGANGSKFLVSESATQGSSIADIQITKDSIQWQLPELRLKVAVAKTSDSLQVTLTSHGPETSVTFPVQPLSRNNAKALIWPHHGGSYIPLSDPLWQDKLFSEEWDTLESLNMPLWGVESEGGMLSCVADNQYHNTIRFAGTTETRTLNFHHLFREGESRSITFRFQYEDAENLNRLQPALNYRDWLIEQDNFKLITEKIAETPNVELLLGAPQIYLWGGGVLTRFDLPRGAGSKLAKKLIDGRQSLEPSPAKHLSGFYMKADWDAMEELAGSTYALPYAQTAMTDRISAALAGPDFFHPESWSSIEFSSATRTLLETSPTLSQEDRLRFNSLALWDAFPDLLPPVETWGGGYSAKMLKTFQEAGLERLRIGLDGWEKIIESNRAAFVRDAVAAGYLIGPYDSYHSIHDPKTSGSESSWPTAQFDQALFESGPIVKKDGTKYTGFNKRGHLLSPIAARPYVEQRVRHNFEGTPFNYYFFDCDGYGQIFDDYSPLHPATQMSDGAARSARMTWVAKEFGAAIGTEGGSAYAANAVAGFEGVGGALFGWGDPAMTDRKSLYYTGGYFPPEAPATFFKSVPATDKYQHLVFDPRFRLPLWECVFHDAAVSGHHWGAASLKFSNVQTTVALTEMLYQTPPMYHINPEEFEKRKAIIMNQYKVFSKMHQVTGKLPLTGFEWLTEDALVQRTTFGDRAEVVVNFGSIPYQHGGTALQTGSALCTLDDQSSVFTPLSK